jgi:hypothetical protein
MYLRDLSLYASDSAELPHLHTSREFNLSTHTPVEAFLDLLPRRKVWLNDLAKVNIVVGPRPDGTPMSFSALNVASVSWPWFDFTRYFSLDRSDQQRRILGVVHKALSRVARQTDSPMHWYDAARATLDGLIYPLSEISDFELRRRWGLLSPRERRSGRRKRRPA